MRNIDEKYRKEGKEGESVEKMKLIHVADLHLGKKVHGHDLLELQKEALNQVLESARQEKVDGILVCGDVYDTVIPPESAVRLLDDWISRLAQEGIPVFIIGGNHDSGTRLDFASDILQKDGVYIAGNYDGTIPYRDLEKGGVKVRVHLFPFIKPRVVREYKKDRNPESWSDAAKAALEDAVLLDKGLNILMSHQFYTGARLSDTEEVYVGTLDQISSEVLKPFDYAALGHLHVPQCAGGNPMYRYPGTLLKYSVSDIGTDRSFTLLEIDDSRNIEIHEIPVKLSADFRKIQGTYDEIASRSFYENLNMNDYYYIVLEDTQEVTDAFFKLQNIYPKILKIEYAGTVRKNELEDYRPGQIEVRRADEILKEFYALQNDRELEPDLLDLMMKIWEELDEAN